MNEVHPGDILASSAPAGRGSVRLIELDGQALLYDDEIRHWLVLNPTAFALWGCLDGSASVAQIADDLSAVFGAKPDTVLEQVLHMVRVLGHHGMLAGVVPYRPPAGTDVPEDGKGGAEATDPFPHVPPTT